MTNAEILMLVFISAIALSGAAAAIIFNRQLSFLRGQLVAIQADRRPWISIEATGHSGIVWEERGARLSVFFTLKNVGRSPATNLFFEAKIGLPHAGHPAIPVKSLLDYSADIRRRRASDDITGETYLPGQTYKNGLEMLIDREAFTSLAEEIGIPSLTPRILACANYSVDSGKTLKQTCTSFCVTPKGHKAKAPSEGVFGLALDQEVPADQFDIGALYYSHSD